MANHTKDSHGGDAALSRVVDSLIRRLRPGEQDAIDGSGRSEQAQGSVSGAASAATRFGDRRAPAAHPMPPSRMRYPRWETRLRRWAWVRVVLGMLLGAAILEWPYGRSCGLPLVAYLGVIGFIVMTALWAGVHTWKTRLATGHVLSLALLAWGTVLAAEEILPRTGYARQDAAWVCTVETATQTSAAVPAR
jgi:hypothetical protein